MERGRLGLELRESAALLRTETWLFVGVGLAWLVYGGWVLATGLLLAQFPGIEGTVLVTLAGRTISLRTVLAASLWLLGPSLATVVLVNRRFGTATATSPTRIGWTIRACCSPSPAVCFWAACCSVSRSASNVCSR